MSTVGPSTSWSLHVVHVSLCSCCLVVMIPSMIFLSAVYARRHRSRQNIFPLRLTPLPLSMFLSTSLTFYIFIELLLPLLQDNFPCFMRVIAETLVLPMSLAILVLKAMIMMVHFKVSRMFLELRHNPLMASSNWLYNHHRRLTSSFFLISLSSSILIFLLLSNSAFLVSDSSLRSVSYCIFPSTLSVSLYRNYFRFFVTLASAPPCLYVAYALREYGQDGADLKPQMKYTAAVGILTAVMVMIVVPAVAPNNWDNPWGTYIACLGLFIIFHLNITWPLRVSYKHEEIAKSVKQKLSDFRHLLSSPPGFDSFLTFVTDEFSSENLVFWDRVRLFINTYARLLVSDEVATIWCLRATGETLENANKKKAKQSYKNMITFQSSSSASTSASSSSSSSSSSSTSTSSLSASLWASELTSIIVKHIDVGSECEVNISAAQGNRLRAAYKKLMTIMSDSKNNVAGANDNNSVDSFSQLNENVRNQAVDVINLLLEAQQEIFNLMNNDSFKRYCSSSHFDDLHSVLSSDFSSHPIAVDYDNLNDVDNDDDVHGMQVVAPTEALLLRNHADTDERRANAYASLHSPSNDPVSPVPASASSLFFVPVSSPVAAPLDAVNVNVNVNAGNVVDRWASKVHADDGAHDADRNYRKVSPEEFHLNGAK